MTCNAIARSAGRSLAALGLVGALAMPASSQSLDPVRQPLWTLGAQQVAALDSLAPTRIGKYQLFAFHLEPSPNTVGAIFDELGAYNVEVWRLGHWEPRRAPAGGVAANQAKYIEPGTLNTVRSGLGYWLITKDSSKVRFDGTAVPTDTFALELQPAANGAPEWNQLGNPFAFNTAVTGWQVVKRDSIFSVQLAAQRNWLDANMRVYNPDNGQFSASGTIPRGAGFFSRLALTDTAQTYTRWQAFSGPAVGFWSSVKLDSKGNPHIVSYQDGNPGKLRYSTRINNRWGTVTLDSTSSTFNGIWASVDIDSLDNPHIAYAVGTSGVNLRAMYTRRLPNGTFTAPEQIEAFNNGYGIRLRLFHGVPRVAYIEFTTRQVKYAERTIGGWVVEPASALAGGNTSIVDGGLGFDIHPVTGVPHIAAPTVNAPFGLRYVTKVGANWQSELVDSLATGQTGIAPSLALDAAGVPHVAYFDQQNVDLKYARRAGANNWVVETVDATGNTGNYSQIQIGPDGAPIIVFLEYASTGIPTRVKYSRRVGGSWSNPEVVDDVGVSSLFAFMGATLAPDGNPRVSYQGVSGVNQLRYAERTPPTVRILIPPVAAPEPALAATPEKPEGAAWAVAIDASQVGQASETVLLGEGAPEWLGALRSARAPSPPTGTPLSLHVPGVDIDVVRDFRAPAESQRWTLALEAGDGPGEQALAFRTHDLPQGMRLFLEDPVAGTTREVRGGDVVRLASRGSRSLELVATTGAGPAVTSFRDGLAFAYPNPFGPRTGFAFTLGRTADLAVDVFDVMGRKVRGLSRAAAAPGEHVLTWNGDDDRGHALPSGVYLARWRAGEAAGTARVVRVQ